MSQYIEIEHAFVRKHGRLEARDVDADQRVFPRRMRRKIARLGGRSSFARVPIAISVENLYVLERELARLREERALLWAWLFGEEVDAAFEAAVWMLCATQNDNGRPE